METIVSGNGSARHLIRCHVCLCEIHKQTDYHIDEHNSKQQRSDIEKRISSVLCYLSSISSICQSNKPPKFQFFIFYHALPSDTISVFNKITAESQRQNHKKCLMQRITSGTLMYSIPCFYSYNSAIISFFRSSAICAPSREMLTTNLRPNFSLTASSLRSRSFAVSASV